MINFWLSSRVPWLSAAFLRLVLGIEFVEYIFSSSSSDILHLSFSIQRSDMYFVLDTFLTLVLDVQ